MAFLDDIIAIYEQFISIFPPSIQWIVSLIVFISVVLGVLQLVKRNFVWIILLIIFIPAAIPILRSIYEGIIAFLDYLI
jgi:hypothetical protein